MAEASLRWCQMPYSPRFSRIWSEKGRRIFRLKARVPAGGYQLHRLAPVPDHAKFAGRLEGGPGANQVGWGVERRALTGLRRQGGIDENMSRAISRTDIDLFIGSGRLCLHAAGEPGVMIGERRVLRDGIETLEDGDTVRVLPKYPDAVSLQVRMRANYGAIDEVAITRIPTAPGADG